MNDPAFPQTVVAIDKKYNEALRKTVPGMSLRDWFAAMALQGMMASKILQRKETLWVAKTAYVAADALLKQREVSHDSA